MKTRLQQGLLAGAAGTLALNLSTYLDMVLRARPASKVPAETAERLAARAGMSLAAEGDEDTKTNRTEGAGALLGYVTGLGLGVLYGLVRPSLRQLPLSVAAVGLGAAAMAQSNVPSVALGVTDPREWGAAGWLSDILPHLAYGVVTAVTYQAISGDWKS